MLKCSNLFISEDDGPIGQAPSTPAPKPPASSKQALPFKPATPAKPTNALGLVNPFPGMDPMKTLALRENKAKMGPKLEQLLANGRKQSVPTVPAVSAANAPRKGSEPVVSTTHLLQARFNKQVSVDNGTDQLATPRVGVGRPDRPLPPPPAEANGRSAADRPLPALPPQITPAPQPPSPPMQSHPKFAAPSGPRTPGRAGTHFINISEVDA